MTRKITLTVTADTLAANLPANVVSLLKQQLTLPNPKYQDAKKYGRWIGKKIKPNLSFYKERQAGLHFPRGFTRQAIYHIRRCTPDCELDIQDHRQIMADTDVTFQGSLRPYQQEAITAITAHEFGVIESGTGSGKTIIALKTIAERRQPTLVLVHTKELLYQWLDQIEKFLGLKAGLIGDGHFEIAELTVAIVNSARNRLDELPQHFGHLVVDECHRVPASLFTDVVTAFDCRYMLGLSATAFRRDGLTRLIYFYLGDRSHRVDPAALHSSGAVLQPEYIQRPTEFSYVYRGNYQHLMKALARNRQRNELIAEDVIREVGREKGTVLVVSDRVTHCEELAAIIARKSGHTLQPAVLTGKLASEERTAIIEAVRRGETEILVSTLQLIGEGFDCPGLRALFLTTPIKFTGRLLQVVGRILRPAAGKKPRVYDYIDPVGVLKASARARHKTLILPTLGNSDAEPLPIRE